MYKQTFTIPSVPPSNNQNQGHRGKAQERRYQDIKQMWADGLAWETYRRRPALPLEHATVIIDYYFKDNRRRDPDNYSGKMILDGLVKNRIIADDSAANIVVMPFFNKDKDYVRTEITVTEVRSLGAIQNEVRRVLSGDINEIQF